ncbi:MAG: hypothetical protein LUG95_02480 [Clostridiales bacterium]|nr:hypothetical protein [Clostridiales bacterium]
MLFDDPNCLYKLGDMYLNGYFVEKNKKYAFTLYDRALEQCEDRDDFCIGGIQFRLGKCLLRGIGTEVDVEQANTFLSVALIEFYKRRSTDPFVKGLIGSTKKMIAEAQEILDKEVL